MRLRLDFVQFSSIGRERHQSTSSNRCADLWVEYHENLVMLGLAFLDHPERAPFEIWKYRLDADQRGDGIVDMFLAVAAAHNEQIGMLRIGDFFNLAAMA